MDRKMQEEKYRGDPTAFENPRMFHKVSDDKLKSRNAPAPYISNPLGSLGFVGPSQSSCVSPASELSAIFLAFIAPLLHSLLTLRADLRTTMSPGAWIQGSPSTCTGNSELVRILIWLP